jgi:hypothetical protein
MLTNKQEVECLCFMNEESGGVLGTFFTLVIVSTVYDSDEAFHANEYDPVEMGDPDAYRWRQKRQVDRPRDSKYLEFDPTVSSRSRFAKQPLILEHPLGTPGTVMIVADCR